MTADGVDWEAAGAQFNQQLPIEQQKHPDDLAMIAEHTKTFLERWWTRFKEDGTLEDRPRTGRPPIISAEEALRASVILKNGRYVDTKYKGKTYQELTGYPTVESAIEDNEWLRNLVISKHISADQLREAMLAHDPDLGRHRVVFKRKFSDAEMQARVDFSEAMLAKLKANPSFLQNVVFIDEASFIIHSKSKDVVHVWADKHAHCFSDVCPLDIPEGDEIKVRFICAVSAHPKFAAKGGLVYMDFTTGTDDINWRVNKRMDGSVRVGNWEYQVGTLHLKKHAVAIAIHNSNMLGCQLL